MTRAVLVATTSLALIAGTLPVTHATPSPPTSSTSISATETNAQGTPANLPYKSLADIRAEALSKGLDADATELAIELQKVVNAYHNLPSHLKEAPLDSPDVQTALLAGASPSLARGAIASGIDFGKASACAKAVVSTLVKRGTPIGQFWTLVETIGGVVELAQGISQILQSTAEEDWVKRTTNKYGKEMGFLLGRILGYRDIVLSCKDLNQ